MAKQKTKKQAKKKQTKKTGAKAKDVMDGVKVMAISKEEGLQFTALDAEMKNALQGIRIFELEISQRERDFQAFVQSHRAKIAQVKSIYNTKSATMKSFLIPVAARHDLDYQQMSIDTETLEVKDLREDPKE